MLGLGFSFGATDKGLQDQISTTKAGLSDITGSIRDIGMKSAQMGLREAVDVPRSAFQTMHQLGRDTRITTTMLEGLGVQYTKATQAGLSGLNQTEEEFNAARREISDTAFAMNVDVGTVTDSFRRLEQAGVDVTEIGFADFHEFQRFMDVTGTRADEFAASVATMREQFGMNNEQIERLITRTQAIGTEMNIGREAMGVMTSSIMNAREETAALFATWDDGQIESFAEGTTKVSGALVQSGLSAEDATQAAQGFANMLMQQEAGMGRLMSGLEEDLPVGMETLTKHLGSVDEAYQMMEESPDQFLLKMRELSDEALEHADSQEEQQAILSRFAHELSGNFGPEVANAVFRSDSFGESIRSVSGDLEQHNDILSETADRYHDGRTMAERFALAEDRIFTNMKQHLGVRDEEMGFLEEYRHQGERLNELLGEWADEGGILGQATEMFVRLSNFGVGGTLGSMHEYGLALGFVAKRFAPIMEMVPSLAISLFALTRPLTLITGAFTGLYFVFKDLEKGEESVVRPMLENLEEILPRIISRVKDIAGVVISGIVEVVTTVWENIPWGRVWNLLQDVGARLVELLGDALVAAGRGIQMFADWLAGVDWERVGELIAKYSRRAFEFILPVLADVAKEIPGILWSAFKAAVSAIFGVIDGLGEYLKDEFPQLWWAIEAGILAAKAAAVMFFATVGLNIIKLTTALAAWPIKTLLVSPFRYFASTAGGILNTVIPGAMANMHGRMLYYAGLTKAHVVSKWMRMRAGMVGAMSTAATAIVSRVRAMAAAVAASARSMGRAFMMAMGPYGVAITAAAAAGAILIDNWDVVSDTLSDIFSGLGSVIGSIWDGIGSMFSNTADTISDGWSVIAGSSEDSAEKMKSNIEDVKTSAEAASSDAASSTEGIFSSVAESIGSTAGIAIGATGEIKNKSEEHSDGAESAWITSSGSIGQTFNTVRDAGIEAWRQLGTHIENVSEYGVRRTRELGEEQISVLDEIRDHPAYQHLLEEGDDLLHQFRDNEERLSQLRSQFQELPSAVRAAAQADSWWDPATAVMPRLGFAEDLRNEIEEIEEANQELAQEYQRQTDESIHAAREAMDMSEEYYGTRLDGIDNVTGAERAAMIELNEAERSWYRDRYARLEEYAARDATTQDDVNRAYQRLEQEASQRLERLAHMENYLHRVREGNTKGWIEDQEEANAIVEMRAESFFQEINAEYASLGENVQDIAQGVTDNFRDMYNEQARELVRQLDEQEISYRDFEQRLQGIHQSISGQASEVHDELREANERTIGESDRTIRGILNSAQSAAEEVAGEIERGGRMGAEGFLGEFESASADVGDVGGEAAENFIEQASEGLSLTEREAADFLQHMAGADPEDLKQGLREVAEAYSGFLSELVDESEGVMSSAREELVDFYQESESMWNDHEDLVETFAENAADHIGRYWVNAINQARNAYFIINRIAVDMANSIGDRAAEIDLMDMIADDDSIARWANSVASALSRAFVRGDVWDAAVQSAHDRASRLAADLGEPAESATPGGDMQAGIQRAEESRAAADIREAINRPEWAMPEGASESVHDLIKSARDTLREIKQNTRQGAAQGGRAAGGGMDLEGGT